VAFVGESRVLVGSDDSTVGLFGITGGRIATGRDHMLPVVAVAGTSSGDLAASADSSGHVHIYSGTDLRNRFAAQLHDEIRSLIFSPSGQHLVAATSEGSIAVINTRTGRVEARLSASPKAVHLCSGVTFSDGGELVSAYDNGLIVLWSPDPQRPQIDLSQVKLKAIQPYRRSTATAGPSSSKGHSPTCPTCRKTMVIRRRNSAPYTRFWGCPSFPRCRGTRPL
jgi:WD40 repeat protein